ncbi:ATP-dependent DNA helicase pif1-like [Senna tora]|uniref:ATP-dependent DNA helicase n=1 Tax=Senna tora TaxID=362788 RepID=A0A834SUX8_9FABA|nr:ATP-dependent DNA helicase pif1-like [Senna tora]
MAIEPLHDRWGEIDEELLYEIAERVDFFLDYVRFRSTCKSWYTKLQIPKYFNDRPLLLLPSDPKNHSLHPDFHRKDKNIIYHLPLPETKDTLFRGFSYGSLTSDRKNDSLHPVFHPKEKNIIFHLPLSDTKDALFRGFSYGWLIAIGLDDTIRMMNPFTKAQIHLPPISGLPHVISFNPERHDEEYTMEDEEGLYTYEKWHVQSHFRKVVLSCPPDDENQNFMAVTITNIRDHIHLCYCRRGDKTWTQLSQVSLFYEDVIFHKGNIYAVDSNGFIHEFDMQTTLGGLSREPYFEGNVRIYNHLYLVQSNGDLLLVFKQADHIVEENREELHTYSFNVFRLDESQNKWSAIKTLNNYALVLGYNSSVCVMPGARYKGNCIYYSDDWEEFQNDRIKGGYDNGIFNFEDGTIHPFFSDPDLIFPPPIWLFSEIPLDRHIWLPMVLLRSIAMSQRAALDTENSLEMIKRQLASCSGRNLLQGPLLKRSETEFTELTSSTRWRFLYEFDFLSCLSILKLLVGFYNFYYSVASSGIASQLIPGGSTAHSRFVIPLNIDGNLTCHIVQGSDLAELMVHTKLIIWNEAPMAHRHCFEALDRTLRDIMHSQNAALAKHPFSGKVVVLGGDFRQILPVIPRAGREDIVLASLISSYLWPSCKVLSLTKNMRLSQGYSVEENSSISRFAEWILKVGEGNICKIMNDEEHEITIDDDILIDDAEDPIQAIVESTYPKLVDYFKNYVYFRERAILSPTLDDVAQVNEFMLGLLPGEERTYLSSDAICNQDLQDQLAEVYTTEFFNTICGSALPYHQLKLKVGAPIMLLRNIDRSMGLCNGTRLILTRMCEHVIETSIMSGKFAGENVLIARMLISPSDYKLPFKFQRRQFPPLSSHLL